MTTHNCYFYKGRDVSIFDLCLSLRMLENGSADPLPEDERDDMLAYLRRRLAEWRPSLSRGARFDECVRQLVIATIAEVDPNGPPVDVVPCRACDPHGGGCDHEGELGHRPRKAGARP